MPVERRGRTGQVVRQGTHGRTRGGDPVSTKLAGLVARERAAEVSWGARCGKTARRVLTGGRGSDPPSLPDPTRRVVNTANGR